MLGVGDRVRLQIVLNFFTVNIQMALFDADVSCVGTVFRSRSELDILDRSRIRKFQQAPAPTLALLICFDNNL